MEVQVMSQADAARPKRRNPQVIAAGELTEQQIAALRGAKVPDQHVDLNEEFEIRDSDPNLDT